MVLNFNLSFWLRCTTLMTAVYHHDGGSKILETVCPYIPDYKAQHIRKQPFSHSLPWELQISYTALLSAASWTTLKLYYLWRLFINLLRSQCGLKEEQNHVTRKLLILFCFSLLDLQELNQLWHLHNSTTGKLLVKILQQTLYWLSFDGDGSISWNIVAIGYLN
jgi:hypothetical protein